MLESENKMDKEAIIALARDKLGMGSEHPLVTVENVMAFAESVSAAEREACAQVCEALSVATGRNRENVGSLEGDTGYECADMIRMRSNARDDAASAA